MTRENVDDYVRYLDHIRAKLRSDMLSHHEESELYSGFVYRVAKSAESSNMPFD